MNEKLKLHSEDNLREILLLLTDVLDGIIERTNLEKEIIEKITLGFKEIKEKSPFSNFDKKELLLSLDKIYKILKKLFGVDFRNWSDEEITSFNTISSLFEKQI